MFENDIVKKAKKSWGVTVPVTKTFGIKIYSLISIGYEEYLRKDLDPKRTEIVEVGTDRNDTNIYATYYFGDDY